jgi:hypothetical protein
VRGTLGRGAGSSAPKPPRTQARIQRSSVSRETRTGSPEGPRCSREATSRARRARGGPGAHRRPP